MLESVGVIAVTLVRPTHLQQRKCTLLQAAAREWCRQSRAEEHVLRNQFYFLPPPPFS